MSPRFQEPCLCGDPECPCCFPSTWRASQLQSAYEYYCSATSDEPPKSFEEWDDYHQELALERKLDELEYSLEH